MDLLKALEESGTEAEKINLASEAFDKYIHEAASMISQYLGEPDFEVNIRNIDNPFEINSLCIVIKGHTLFLFHYDKSRTGFPVEIRYNHISETCFDLDDVKSKIHEIFSDTDFALSLLKFKKELASAIDF